MKDCIAKLFEKSVLLQDGNTFTDQNRKSKWIGNSPATLKDIKDTEIRLGIKLPNDYKEFVGISNGYPTCNDGVEPSFIMIQQIEYLINYNPELVKGASADLANDLSRSIIIGGKEEEQYFLLIPPSEDTDKWKYWKFANWIPGEEAYLSLQDYFLHVIKFIEDIQE